jgi:hypothetical protein
MARKEIPVKKVTLGLLDRKVYRALQDPPVRHLSFALSARPAHLLSHARSHAATMSLLFLHFAEQNERRRAISLTYLSRAG